ncbi:ABC transporter substrate-binding protein [Halobacterium zhouii]|uniref:ABC transporter substrate-binding protein n=1 Tax=Halobacterium zhouii TaxID=2902624 RepID=UPI001E47F8AA|nr:ABC transporter substrate-binding protein [Halobacterium zhouii]
MNSETTRHTTPTRREYVRGTGAVLAGGLLAGCTQPTNTAGSGSPDGDETQTDDTSYTASMAPVGDVEFSSVPESAFVAFPQYADMAVALGHGDAVNALYVPEMSGTTMNHYYDRLDGVHQTPQASDAAHQNSPSSEGVSFDWEGLPDPLADGLNKEQLYALNSDVHFIDPAYVSAQDGWTEEDIDGIARSIGPWFGNFYSGTHDDPPAGYQDAYEFYDLWTLFGRVADVFQERARYRELNAVREEMLAHIESNLPPKAERPTAVRVTLSDDSFYTYHLNKPGYWLADTRPLGARDAFADQDWSSLWGTVGYETMLDADPDVILHLWGTTPNYDMATVRENLRSHTAGKRLSAVKNDRVYASGMRYQGPLMNLFQTEMTAKQLYPERFGEWPEYEDGAAYPEIPPEEQLFDRERVARAVTRSS